jgi:hypothetical protein
MLPAVSSAALPTTRLSRLSRTGALLALLGLAVAIAALIAVASGTAPSAGAPSANRGDVSVYARVVDAMRHGQGYYAAAHAELLAGGYGTRSVFNWRLPALPWLVSLAPSTMLASIVLVIAAAVGVLLAFHWIEGAAGRFTALLAAAFAIVSLAFVAAPNAALFADIVAGTLVFLSVAAYGARLPWLGFAAAVLALFCRELVAPYALISALFAVSERRRAEVAAWVAAFIAFATYFAWHYTAVHAAIGPADPAYPDGWLRFGGLAFVLATAGFNGLLSLAPLWLSAIILPCALLGLVAWPGSGGRRAALAVTAYVVLFLFVGKPFDAYWGALYTPLLMLGLAFALTALRDLIAAARSPRLAYSHHRHPGEDRGPDSKGAELARSAVGFRRSPE